MKQTTFILIALTLIIGFIMFSNPASAQCAMCKAVLEGEITNGGNRKSEGINSGILFLMGIPYLLIGVAILYFVKTRKSLSQ